MKHIMTCQYCGKQFTARRNDAKFCSTNCCAAKQYQKKKAIKRQQEAEQNEIIMQVWHDRERLGLKRAVCANCFLMWWTKEPTLYCSDCKNLLRK